MKLFRILDPFTITLITVVLLASFFPAEGGFVPFFEGLTTAAIALLFFMHGAKLSREAIIAGGSHWRLHLWVMCSTFVVFPVLGVLFAWWAPVNVDPMLYTGFLYLCILPATVQSAIAFTSLAGGERCRRRVFRFGLQPAGYFSLAVACWPGHEYAWRRRQPGAGGENHAAAAAAVRTGTSFASVDW